MNLQQFTQYLQQCDKLQFVLPNGLPIPDHFHITEIGKVTRAYIDCGGTYRTEEIVNFQLWYAKDYDHRLQPKKLKNILKKTVEKLSLHPESTVKVEYQGSTIETYELAYEDGVFSLLGLQTDCLAKDNCGIPQEKLNNKESIVAMGNNCNPNSNCC